MSTFSNFHRSLLGKAQTESTQYVSKGGEAYDYNEDHELPTKGAGVPRYPGRRYVPQKDRKASVSVPKRALEFVPSKELVSKVGSDKVGSVYDEVALAIRKQKVERRSAEERERAEAYRALLFSESGKESGAKKLTSVQPKKSKAAKITPLKKAVPSSAQDIAWSNDELLKIFKDAGVEEPMSPITAAFAKTTTAKPKPAPAAPAVQEVPLSPISAALAGKSFKTKSKPAPAAAPVKAPVKETPWSPISAAMLKTWAQPKPAPVTASAARMQRAEITIKEQTVKQSDHTMVLRSASPKKMAPQVSETPKKNVTIRKRAPKSIKEPVVGTTTPPTPPPRKSAVAPLTISAALAQTPAPKTIGASQAELDAALQAFEVNAYDLPKLTDDEYARRRTFPDQEFPMFRVIPATPTKEDLEALARGPVDPDESIDDEDVEDAKPKKDPYDWCMLGPRSPICMGPPKKPRNSARFQRQEPSMAVLLTIVPEHLAKAALEEHGLTEEDFLPKAPAKAEAQTDKASTPVLGSTGGKARHTSSKEFAARRSSRLQHKNQTAPAEGKENQPVRARAQRVVA